MEKKRYKTSAIRYTMNIVVDGAIRELNFNRVSSVKSGSAYTTSCAKEQDAIEKSIAFNKRVFIDRAFNPNDAADIKKRLDNPIGGIPRAVNTNPKMVLKEFKNVNEAKDYFTGEHELPVSKLATKAQIKTEGKKLGYEIKFSND